MKTPSMTHYHRQMVLGRVPVISSTTAYNTSSVTSYQYVRDEKRDMKALNDRLAHSMG